MYQRESSEAPSRLEPVIQAATLGLQSEFLKRKLRVLQPTQELYALLDQGQSVVITFATDAGFSLVFSAYADMRPAPGQDGGIADVRLATRVFVGRNVLAAEEGRGQMFTRLEPATREFGIRRAMELAARRAAADVVERIAAVLEGLTSERINEMVGANQTSVTTSQIVSLPPGSQPAGGVVAPPALAPDATATAPSPTAPTPAAPASATPLDSPRNRYALVVGMSNYSVVRAANSQLKISDLKGVAKDVDFVVASLLKLGYAQDRMTVLQDAQATGSAVRGAIKELAGKTQADDQVVIFIAGHGLDKNESASGFGMPVLADFRRMDAGSLDFWELQSYVKNLKGKVVWINDTCHSGGAASNVTSVVVSSRGLSAKVDVRGPDAGTVASNAGPGQDFAILTACMPNELSLETSEGGLFTTSLFKELVRTNGRVPLGQVFAQTVAMRVIERSRAMCDPSRSCGGNRQQTPVMAFSGNGSNLMI